MLSLSGYKQNTTYSVKYFDDKLRDFSFEVDSILDDFDKKLSIYDSSSMVSQINRNIDIEIDKTFLECFCKAMDVSKVTDGAFDITVAPIISVWGFGKEKRKTVSQIEIDSILQFVGYKKVWINNNKIVKQDPRITLNFNAIAQGYSVDIISFFLQSKKIENYVVEIGGEVFAKGTKPDGSPWYVGVEKPADNTSDSLNDLKLIIKLMNMAVSTSGNYRNFYIDNGVKYSHTINPKTGYPVKNTLLSATIVAIDCASADAYATACMVKGLDNSKLFLEMHPELEAYLLYSNADGKIDAYMTKSFEKLITKLE